MFKKLRNRMLIVNTLIIAALVLGSFSFIYIMTAQNVNRGIDQKLERAVDTVHSQHASRQKEKAPKNAEGDNAPDAPSAQDPPPDAPDAAENPPEIPEGGDAPDDTQEKQIFSLTFTVTTDADGNILEKDIPFELDEDFYSDSINDIIYGEKDEGRIKADTGLWAYKVLQLDTGYVVAFTECQAERSILFSLALVLMLVGLFALTAAFLISLYSANRSIRPVEESYNKQKRFVADASHELKTPMTTINTNVDVLLSHPESTIGEERKWLDYIKTEAERMTKLTNELLYLAKLDHSDSSVILSKVSFSEAAESVILLMEAVIFENRVNLDYNITPDIYVNGSAEQLKQLVMILLDNAVKYTPKSGNISITLTRDSSDAVFKIYNTGEGISDEAQKQIFERFYREDKSRARESGGYGLGLAIAKAITDSCKGSISVKSQKNEFTEFTVRIPIMK